MYVCEFGTTNFSQGVFIFWNQHALLWRILSCLVLCQDCVEYCVDYYAYGMHLDEHRNNPCFNIPKRLGQQVLADYVRTLWKRLLATGEVLCTSEKKRTDTPWVRVITRGVTRGTWAGRRIRWLPRGLSLAILTPRRNSSQPSSYISYIFFLSQQPQYFVFVGRLLHLLFQLRGYRVVIALFSR